MIPGTLDAGGPLWGWDWDSDDDWDLAVLALLALAVVAATALALHWFGSGQDHEVGQPASTAPRAQPPQAGDKLALHPKSKASGGGLEQQSPGQGKPEAPGQDQKSSATAGAQDQKPSTGRGMAPTDGLPLKTLGRVISRGVSGQQQANSAPGAPQDKERECSSPDSALLVRSKARGIPAPLLIHFTPRSPGSKMEAQVQEGGTGTKESACQAPACAEQKDTSSWHLSVKAPGSRRRDEGNFQWWLDSSSRDRTSHAPKPDPLRLGAAVSVWDVVDGAFKATQDSQAHSPCKSPPLPYSTPEPSGQDLTGASTTQIQLGANSSEDRQGGSNVQSSPTRAVCSGVKTKESRETGSSALRETQRVEAREGGWTWAAKEPALISSSFSCVPGMTGTQELPWELCSADQRDTEKQGSHPVREDWGSLKSQSSEQVARGSAADWRPPGPLKAHCWPTAGHSCSPSQSSPAPSSSQSLESGSPSETAACSPLSLLPVGLNHSHSLNEDKNLRASPVSLSAPILASAQVSTSVPTAVLAPFSFPSPAPVRTLTPTLIPASSPTALSVPSSPAASPLSPSPSSAPASAPAPVTVLTPISMPVSSPASPSGPASTPPSPLLSPPTSASAPGVAADSAVTSRSSLVPEEPSLHLSKGSQKGQVSTSWGNLIAMVLRSHPFPRQEQAQGSAPKAVPGTSPGPSTLLHAEDKQPSSLSEVPIPSPQDRCISSLGKGTKAGSGDLAETGCQPQSISFKTNGIPISSSLPGGKGDGTKEKTLDLLSPATMPTPLLQPSKETQPSSVPSSTTRQDSQPISRLQKGSICEIVQKSELVTTQTGPGKQRQVPAEGPSPADSREILREKQKEAQKLMFFLQRPGSWGVVEGLQKTDSRAATEAPWPRQVDLSNCLEVLAFAQQHGEPGLAQETYAVMSNNLLRVLGDPHLYRQLSGADRERILNLRTCQGQTVLGVLVLPSLYQVSRSGLGRPSPGEEAAAAGPAPLPPLTHLHVFIPQENSWRLLTQVPEEAPLRGCGLCTMHNYLFLAGGIRGSGTKAVCSNQVFCYNPLTNIWSQVRPMQQARAQLKLVALEGQLYAIGGECLYSMERYDPRTDTWTLRAPLPEGTFPVAHEAVACRGDIYVTGGHLFYRLLRYSPIKDLWVECPYSASHRRSSDMVALGGFLYRFDLLRGVGAAVMRYNTVTGSWSRAASLPLPDPAPLRCTVLGNTIYCLNHQVTATFTVSEGTAQFQAKELQPFPLGSKGILCPFTLTLPTEAQLQTAL